MIGQQGKMAQFKKLDWWKHGRGEEEAKKQLEDKATVQQFEAELMEEFLGNKPKKLMLQKKQLTPEEMKQLLNKDEMDKERAEELAKDPTKAAKGLGFASHRTAELEAKKAALYGLDGMLEGLEDVVKKEEPRDDDGDNLGGYEYVNPANIKLDNSSTFPDDSHYLDGGSVGPSLNLKNELVNGGIKEEPVVKDELKDEPGENNLSKKERKKLKKKEKKEKKKEKKKVKKEMKKEKKRLRKEKKKEKKGGDNKKNNKKRVDTDDSENSSADSSDSSDDDSKSSDAGHSRDKKPTKNNVNNSGGDDRARDRDTKRNTSSRGRRRSRSNRRDDKSNRKSNPRQKSSKRDSGRREEKKKRKRHDTSDSDEQVYDSD